MQQRTSILSAFTLTTAMAFGAAAMAADLPKEGTYSGIYAGFAAYKATSIGNQLLVAFDENGLTVGTGLFDHMTWHCWGMGDFTNGMGPNYGHCVGTDPDGDQIAGNFRSDKDHAPDERNWPNSLTLTTGSGKYAGISGGWAYVYRGHEFHPGAEGTYYPYATYQGSYKLP
jgi:hypothetical protein